MRQRDMIFEDDTSLRVHQNAMHQEEDEVLCVSQEYLIVRMAKWMSFGYRNV